MLHRVARVVIFISDKGHSQKVQLFPEDQHLQDVQSGPVREDEEGRPG